MNKLLLDAFKSLEEATDIEIPANYTFKLVAESAKEKKPLNESLIKESAESIKVYSYTHEPKTFGSKKEATEFYMAGACCTDHCQNERNKNILKDLEKGYKICWDGFTPLAPKVKAEYEAQFKDKAVNESLKESKESEVTKWWKEVEEKFGNEFNIDNGDYSDIDGMHAAMFDILKDIKEKDSKLFRRGKNIYNKYAVSQFNEAKEENTLRKAGKERRACHDKQHYNECEKLEEDTKTIRKAGKVRKSRELENLDEASSAEKKAFKNGGEDSKDYIDGKAIARIKDKDERARAIANKKLEKSGKLGDRTKVDTEYERKVNQAAQAYEKKAQKMLDAGVKAEESLTESRFEIDDQKEIEQAKKVLDGKEEPVEKIVDVDASTVDELKDSYVGNVILQCPVCRTLIYKKPDAINKDEDSSEEVAIYNKSESCPHCGSEDGFELVGQVATLDVKTDEPEATTGKEEQDEISVSTEEESENINKNNLPELEVEEEDIKFESFDENKFDNLLNEFLVSKFSNVKEYKTTDGSIDQKHNLTLEGILSYNSGKSEKLSFVFEPTNTLNENIDFTVVFNGVCEKFSKLGTFSLSGKICENSFNSEQLNIK